MQLVVRPAKVSDVPKMYDISVRTHQASYATLIPARRRADFNKYFTFSDHSRKFYVSQIASKLKKDNWFMWVAEIDDRVVGYTFEEQVDEQLIQKRGLFVDPDYYNQGIGTILFKKSLEIASKGTKIRLSVIENNYKAKRLYERYGFTFAGYDTKTFFDARLEVMERSTD